MNKTDFNHLVRLSEADCAENVNAYRRGVAAFAAIGYVWVIGCFLLALVVITWSVRAMLQNHLKLVYIGWAIAGMILLWTSLKALWCPLIAPEGLALTPKDAPQLFEGLEKIRTRINGPQIHHVFLNDEFNASISQRPRFGLFGGSINYLTIGLPFLMALDKPRFFAVMAHEYGHLRSGHGQFSAWVYRTRLSWSQLAHSMRNEAGPVAMATDAFLRWYYPRFLAKSFALARQDEYEADRISAKLLGADVAGAALAETSIKGDWLATEFWSQHWRSAALNAQSQGPFSAMRLHLAQPPSEQFARDTLKQTLRQISSGDDTHPMLLDRLEALNASLTVPAWSTRPAIAMLGAKADALIQHFDKEWCEHNRAEWKHHHAYLNRVKTRIDTLTANIGRNNASEMSELGDLHMRLDPSSNVRSHYEHALQMTPNHAGGLRGLVRTLTSSEHTLRLDSLSKLYDTSLPDRYWVCNAAVEAVKKPDAEGDIDSQALDMWRERLKQANSAEERAWEELSETSFFQSISRHDLNEFESAEFHSDMVRCEAVKRAWLVRKNLREFAYRRCYILFIELPTLDDEERYDLCRNLERSLDLPGQVLVLWAGDSPTLADIKQHAFEPLYIRGK
jgi:Peptidase family M48